PAVILSSVAFNQHHEDVILAAITSQVPEVLTSNEYLLHADEQRAAGLPKPSIVKVGKIVTLDQRLIRKQLGRMPETGQQLLIHIVMSIFGAEDREDRSDGEEYFFSFSWFVTLQNWRTVWGWPVLYGCS